ncbi:MAG: preprotein translocase subunit SecG [Planctomycetota bacterium]|nr:MAG: preprotein translocase subunit SecG [Planctomycetota bacterium]
MTVIYVLLCFVCVVLTGLVLIQDSKSGGLGGITGSSTMASLGANTDKTIIKVTGVCAFLFFTLILMTHLLDTSNKTYKSVMGKETDTIVTDVEDSKTPNKKDVDLKSDAKTIDAKKIKAVPTDDSNTINSKEGTTVVVPIPADKEKSKDNPADNVKDKEVENSDKKAIEPKKEETPK